MNESQYVNSTSSQTNVNITQSPSGNTHINDLLNNFEYAVDWAHIACSPITIIMNLLVILLAVKYIDLGNRLNQWYVLSMTVSDLTYGIVYLSTKKMMAYFPKELCQVYYTLSWVSQIMSIFSMLLLNIDKFISLSNPLNYHQIVSVQLVAGLLSLCWAVAIAYSVFTFYGPLSEFKPRQYAPGKVTECSPSINPINYLAMLVLLYIIPMIVCFSISVFIYYIAKNLGRGLPGVPESRVARQRVKQKMVKRIIFVFSSTMWTVITYLPYRIFMAYYLTYCVFLEQQCNSSIYLKVTGWALWLFMPMGAIGNPIITIVTQRVYRLSLNKFCRQIAITLHIPERFCPCISRKTSTLRSPKYSEESTRLTRDVNLNLIASSVRNQNRLGSSEIGTPLSDSRL